MTRQSPADLLPLWGWSEATSTELGDGGGFLIYLRGDADSSHISDSVMEVIDGGCAFN